ncbi:inactive protein RESTRICTED TEV MOVEMENT 2-like [Chenopodium quinoa]|uniref:SHSP domain-containing protein n=1 Tax=Chenopodium quinoa TaxID=63459 RepID=A0A803N3B9_CHEQI|nr:inactive protein RESTRICTED TEV MOVEMENT 2-like [Chenopodium quinoa]
MANRTKTATISSPTYIDFEPYCEWKKEEGTETLDFHLPDFKKDQLIVQVNNLGVLKVSGEKPATADGTKRNRFVKETKIPQGCDINDIRAKFSGGHLHVTMPKKASPQIEQQQMKPETTSSSAPKPEVTQKPTSEAQAPKAEKPKAPSSENGKAGTSTSYDQAKGDNKFGLGSSVGRLQVHKKVNVGLGVAVAAVVAIGVYVAFKYGSSSSPPSNIED